MAQVKSPNPPHGNRISLLEAGAEYFPALLAAIDAAREEVSLETYIFENDATGRQVALALAQAAGRGVRVRVLVDGFGSPHFHRQFSPMLAKAGVRALVYRRFGFPFTLSRLHRKVAVVDGSLALVGGINIVSDDSGPPEHAAFRLDYALRVEGPLAALIREDARQLWNQATWSHLRRAWRVPRAPKATGHLQRMADFAHRLRHPLRSKKLALIDSGPMAAFVTRNNVHHRHDIEQAYLDAIRCAREEIIMAHAYFLPGRRLRQALVDAAKRGVKISLLLPGVVEFALVNHASQALCEPLLAAGVRLHAYRRSFLHAKVAVIDRHWVTVGSSNIDPLSLNLAREANIVTIDPKLAEALRLSLQSAIGLDAKEIPPREILGSPWPARLLRHLSLGLIRLLAKLAGAQAHA